MCYDYGRTRHRYPKRVEQYSIRVFIRMENDEFRKGFLGILKIIHLFFSLVLYFLMEKLYVFERKTMMERWNIVKRNIWLNSKKEIVD